MKNKTILILLAMVLVIGGAALLYKKLGSGSSGGQLQTLAPPVTTARDASLTPTGTSAPASTSATAPATPPVTAPRESVPFTEVPATTVPVTTTVAATTPPATPAAESETRDPRLQLAPDVTVYDAQGGAHKLSDFRGKPVVLNFWASWCPPCKSEMPDFDEKYKELGEEIHFLMVNVTDNQRETVRSASAFIEEMGYVFPLYFDTSQEAATAYQAYSIPRTFFIDAEGYLVANALGAISGEILQQGIDMIR